MTSLKGNYGPVKISDFLKTLAKITIRRIPAKILEYVRGFGLQIPTKQQEISKSQKHFLDTNLLYAVFPLNMVCL